MAFPATVTNHAPAFGGGETLFPGVYYTSGAGSIGATLTLDGQGDPNAVFIFQFAGAFTTGASSTVVLNNGARACNVFWGANGAIAMAAITAMKGTLIANGGAISMGADGTLVGRMLSTVGAASVYNVAGTIPPICLVFPVELLSFTGRCVGQQVVLNWSTATEKNNDYFTVERSVEGQHWQIVGTIDGKGNSTSPEHYTLTDMSPHAEASFYRLKQTDFNTQYQYGNMLGIKMCADGVGSSLSVFPNPSDGIFVLSYTGDADRVISTELFNAQGRKLYSWTGFQSTFDLSDRAPGVYFVHVQLASNMISVKMIVEK